MDTKSKIVSIILATVIVGPVMFVLTLIYKDNYRTPHGIESIINERPKNLLELKQKVKIEFPDENIDSVTVNSYDDSELDQKRRKNFPNTVWYFNAEHVSANLAHMVEIHTQSLEQRWFSDGAFTTYYVYLDRNLNILGVGVSLAERFEKLKATRK